MNDPIYIPDSPPPQHNPAPPPLESAEKFCSLCLRERPPGGEFYEYSSANGAEFQESIRNNVGLELTVEEFDICTPCWKMVHLMEDFRLCCFKAQERLVGSTAGECRGVKETEEWFQEEVVEAIDSLRSIIQQQVMEIEWDEVGSEDSMQAETVLDEEGQSLAYEQVDGVEANGELVTQISVGDFKIEVFDDEVQEEDCNARPSIAADSAGITDQLRCAKCRCRYENKEDFRDHIQYCRQQPHRNQGSNIRHNCTRCLTSFKQHYLLEFHMSTSHGITSYECESNCRKNLDFSATKIINDSKSKVGVVCQVCNAILANSKSLRSHKVVAHGEKKFPCEYCSKKFTRMHELKRHSRVVHSVLLVSSPQVSKDPQPTTTSHSAETNHNACDLCSSTFSTSTELVRHRTMVHLDQLRSASAASSSASSPAQVINLVDDHQPNGKLQHQCPTCKKSFVKYLTLLDHVRRWHSHLVQEFIAARQRM